MMPEEAIGRKQHKKERSHMKISKLDVKNKIAIMGDKDEPIIAAIREIQVKHPELYTELQKVITVCIKNGSPLYIREEMKEIGTTAKMNAAAYELYIKWENIYHQELERLRKEKNDPEYHEGWCIIENDNFIKSLDDVVGLLIFGYDDNALYTVCMWINDNGEEDTYWGYRLKDIYSELEKYYREEALCIRT